MPQPLSQVQSDAGVRIGNAGDRPFLRHPQLGVLAIEAIASWANVEGFMLRFFVQLFGGSEAVAAAVYLGLTGAGPKKAAVISAADVVLNGKPDQRSLLDAILAVSATNEKARDKLAHWTWGDSPHPRLSDALLLVNPINAVQLEKQIDKSEIFVYREQDFLDIIRANDRLCGYLRIPVMPGRHSD